MKSARVMGTPGVRSATKSNKIIANLIIDEKSTKALGKCGNNKII